MLFGLVKGAVKGTILTVVVVAAAASYGYYRVAARKVPAPPGTVVTAGVCKTTPSLSGGTLPVTFEAYVKDAGGHNFLATDGSAGLVKARYEWSHGGFGWTEDAGFAERQADLVKERKRLAMRDVDALIKDLRSDDIVRREVSAKELKIRTGQTFGYAYDGPKEEREKAAEAWERWWANDENKWRYGAKRVLDGADKALDTLRKALGTDEQAEKEARPK